MTNCPYCGEEVEINHDDGYGYSEDEVYQQECGYCDKTFVYTTYIHFSYNLHKADCLNGGEHKWKPSITFPKEYTRMYCTECDESRGLTDSERQEIMK